MKKDISGVRYGKLVAIKPCGKAKNGRTLWECQCDCGNAKIADVSLLNNGRTKSCGCFQKESQIKNATKHGLRKSRLYTIWSHMKDRCDNPKSKIYKWYGGRGITYCEEWSDVSVFANWAKNNGYQDDLTLDRIDVNGNYEPSNCRWATVLVQGNNKTSSRIITYNGETKTMAEWCREYGFKWETIRDRIDRLGWTFERAITTPVKKQNRRK